MKDVVRIGIIGTGFARKVQIPSFQLCEGAEVVSIASASLTNAKATAEEFGIDHFTADWRETISRDDVDLVCITTPPKFHREMTLAAIQNGKHLLCEKPMAMNAEEAREMTEAARGAGVLALIDHELRFQPGRLRAYEMIREGLIGKIRHAKCHFQAPHRGDPSLPWNWWSDVEQGGGALGAIASHVIDSFHWFLGTTVSSVSCQLQSHIKERPTSDGGMRPVTSDDESLLILRFAEGDLLEDATGLVSVSMVEYPKYKHRVELYGTKGALAVEARGEVFFAEASDTEWKQVGVDFGPPIPGVPDTGFSSGFTMFAPKIVEALREGQTEIEHAATFEDGLNIQRVLDAARESDRTQRVVQVRRHGAAA
ncbi:MAG TPA: Gfo/Idh/MocA family oxidoreductase [Pyrinomonadaceae bacterium]|nr:Gfo/Idh/MocA family oxidoreductase [Pyrinomonadaceae bacterium]